MTVEPTLTITPTYDARREEAASTAEGYVLRLDTVTPVETANKDNRHLIGEHCD